MQEAPAADFAEGPVSDALRPVIAAAAVVVSLLACAGILVYGSGRGFDLTDEVFYLIWARDPHAYAITYQPFGYLLHPLFLLARANLQAYRLLGFACAAGAGAVLGIQLAPSRAEKTVFGLYGATAGLTIFFPWIVTPSYNSAANIGAILIVAAVLGAARRAPWAGLVGALGLCIAGFAKPPLFVVSLLVMVALAYRLRQARAAVLTALIVGATLVALLLPPTEWLGLVRRILASQQALELPNTVSGLPAKVARDWLLAPPTLSAAAVAAAIGLAVPASRWSRLLGYAAIVFTLGYVPQAVQDLMDGDMPDFIGLGLVLAATGYVAVLKPWAGRLAPLLLLSAPAAVALGTFNNQWAQLNFSLVFPLLAIFALKTHDPAPWRRLIAHAVGVLAPVTLLLVAAFKPYSLPVSIFQQQSPIAVPLVRGTIRADPETARFVQSARNLAAGDVLIDLSGAGPGVAAVLGAEAPVLPWLNPATPTWPDLVWSRLSPKTRETASFVVPVWPQFAASAPAQWLAQHRNDFCRTSLPPMTFWREERTLELWRRCSNLASPHG